MKTDQFLKQNAMIALFMGLYYPNIQVQGYSKTTESYPINETINAWSNFIVLQHTDSECPSHWNQPQVVAEYRTGLIKELRYHTDWDWIMPVLERIEALEGIDRVDLFYRNCQITYQDEDNEYLRGGKDCQGIKGETKLLAVYQACVEFIEWFNTITPNIHTED